MLLPRFLEAKIHRFIRNRIYLPDDLEAKSDIYGDVNFKRISVVTKDGVHLDGLRSEHNENSRFTLLYFHGNGGCAANRAALIAPLYKAGADIIVADYRGYGKNQATPTEEGLVADALAFAELAKTSNSKPIIIFGHSLGGALAVQLIARNPDLNGLKGLVTLGMFSSLAARAPDFIVPYLPDQLDSIAAVNEVKLPWRILHEQYDEVTPYTHSKALFDAKKDKGKTELIILKGGSHALDTDKLLVVIEILLSIHS